MEGFDTAWRSKFDDKVLFIKFRSIEQRNATLRLRAKLKGPFIFMDEDLTHTHNGKRGNWSFRRPMLEIKEWSLLKASLNSTIRFHNRKSEIPGTTTQDPLSHYKLVFGIVTVCFHLLRHGIFTPFYKNVIFCS
ncbi:hypothetical protein O6H91_05G059200 [Diphasiastrum complanatum]|uniref:Uncharacterized protein n=1 Tax=Diphasiastrum complanatum TaxID=34168 RepID=A0ACC2DPH0_DIPCM|nr:hypothetical protein O6H91_05G059200 [Diphasiastrum complanatum]